MSRIIFDDKERIGAWVAKQTGQTAAWGDFYAMGAENDGGETVAGIVCNNYNGANATAHIAIAKPGKYMHELLRHFCQYAFVQCGLKRITGMVSSAQPKVIAFDRHLGFEDEFVMKDASPDGDMHILVMWAHKCPWLDARR